jgi:hypothetical protein
MAPTLRPRKNGSNMMSAIQPAPAAVVHEGSPDWNLDHEGNLPSRSQSPDEADHVSVSAAPEDEPVEETEADEDVAASQLVTQSALNARRPRWQPYQDRMLAETVEEVKPFEATTTDAIKKAWQRVSVKLLEASIANGATGNKVINRTGEACKARFNLLLKHHRVHYLLLNLIPRSDTCWSLER